MRADVMSKALSLAERCAAIDWRQPWHDPARVTAAYERWMATLGLERRIRWVSDPADVDAWQMRGPGVAQVWSFLAADNRPSTIALLLNLRPGAATSPPSSPISHVAAAWASAITLHMTIAEAGSDASARAWMDVVAREPAMMLATTLLCPGAPWAPPPTIACAASDVLPACANPTVWATLRDVLHGQLIGNEPVTQEQIVETLIAITEPVIDAYEAGAFAHALLNQEIVVLAAPSVFTDGRRLHRADGAALAWSRTKLYAWKGVLVPKEIIVQPRMITPEMISAVPDQRLQRTLVDIYAHTHGHQRCMQDLGGIMMHEDHTGRLWLLNPARRTLPPEPGDLKLVEVMNGTAEPDGTHKTYWLNVPPEMRTAQEAVAWTYGLTTGDYDGLVVRT